MQTAISGVKNLFCNPLFLLPQVPADKFLPLPMHLSQSSSPRCRQSGCNLRKRFLPLMKHIGINIHIFYFRAQCSRKYYLVQTHANSFSFQEESMEPVCEQTLGEEILHFQAKLAFSAKYRPQFLHFQKNMADPAKSRADFLHFHAKLAFSAKYWTLFLHFQKNMADPAKSRADFLHFQTKLAFSAKSKIKTVHFQSKRLIPAQHFKQTSFP